ncbi:hypothetical protein [Rhizobium sp. MHM7A]|uniref:hypothetical protein n=1 Tax=Rhizobium sp. MHM7A TaxID=2583233 RepID=UPI001106DFE0|nr:hypothetical protein [Rhizobium sp. MHM7A]TLX15986.1 hypothetical protein FFR93_01325 [Rhizobium sp. MHM7A]
MSSAAYLKFKEEIPLTEWAAFCEEHSIRYSPNTVGQATFYGGSTEISVTPQGSVERDERNRPIWSTAQPPAFISRMTVGTFYQGDLGSVGSTINAIASRFPCTASCDPELAYLLVNVPQTHEIDEMNDFISTDFVEAWTFLDDAYTLSVPAGDARVTKSGENWAVELSGIKRGTFIDLNHAFAFAGRASWNWWYGPRPEEQTHTKALPHG